MKTLRRREVLATLARWRRRLEAPADPDVADLLLEVNNLAQAFGHGPPDEIERSDHLVRRMTQLHVRMVQFQARRRGVRDTPLPPPPFDDDDTSPAAPGAKRRNP